AQTSSWSHNTAILQYLAQKYSSSVADHWYAADLQQRACVDEYLSWQHMNLRLHGTKVFLFKCVSVIRFSTLSSCTTKEKVDAAVKDLNQSLKLLEDKFLQSKPLIIGVQISLANLVATVVLMQVILLLFLLLLLLVSKHFIALVKRLKFLPIPPCKTARAQ
uniref:Uncharacterized protein n=1 Tax=Monopterus albus TaxID=43700 RepID=A0A3Q3IWF2_MONAL